MHHDEIPDRIAQLEEEWCWALLARLQIDPAVIQRARVDEAYLKSDWRDLLLSKHGIQIERDLTRRSITFKKINLKTGRQDIIGEWKHPTSILFKQGKERWYEIKLDYYSLL